MTFDLINATDLNIGQETTEASSGGSGGVKYPRTVKTGIYLVEANRYAAFGKVAKEDTFGDKDKKIQDRMRFGFEILQCVIPLDAGAADQVLVKEFGDDKEPYTVDINGGLDFNRSSHVKAGYPVIRDSLFGALPMALVEKLEDQDKVVTDVFKNLKQLMGQQFLLFIYEEQDKDGKGVRNHINISGEKAVKWTEALEAKGIKYKINEGLSIFPIDGEERYSGTKKLPNTAPAQALRTKSIVWDISAEDMTQAHLDAVAHEYVFVGEECSPTDHSSPEYCQLLKMQLVNGTLQGTAVGRKLESGELKIPDPRQLKAKESAETESVAKVDFEDTKEIAEPPFEPNKPVKAQSAEDAAVEDEAAEFDL